MSKKTITVSGDYDDFLKAMDDHGITNNKKEMRGHGAINKEEKSPLYTYLERVEKQIAELQEFNILAQKQIGELQEHALKLEKQIWLLQDQQK